MYQNLNQNCNILYILSTKFMVFICVLVFSCFIKNPSTLSWLTTHVTVIVLLVKKKH
jgi:hypothetical protein